jgi:hypothetical protein
VDDGHDLEHMNHVETAARMDKKIQGGSAEEQ